MSNFTFSNEVAESQPQTTVNDRQARAMRRAHDRTVRFHLLLNLGFALAATWVLKIDGPYYADGISAGLFACGLFVTLWSRRAIAVAESEAGYRRSRLLSWMFLAFAAFFAGAAVSVVYFTYIVPPDMPFSEEDAVTLNLFLSPGQFA